MIATNPDHPSAATALDAWNNSEFLVLPDELRDELLGSAQILKVPALNPIFGTGGRRGVGILNTGQARVKVVSEEGRAATLRYLGPGNVLGLPAVLTKPRVTVGSDTITDCEITSFDVATVERLARSDPRLTWLFAQLAAEIIYETIDFLAGNLFGHVVQRVSRHLLDLAWDSDEGFVVLAEQQEIANAIGSVREVVARSLKRLREAGHIERRSGGIVIVNPRALHAIAAGGPVDSTLPETGESSPV